MSDSPYDMGFNFEALFPRSVFAALWHWRRGASYYVELGLEACSNERHKNQGDPYPNWIDNALNINEDDGAHRSQQLYQLRSNEALVELYSELQREEVQEIGVTTMIVDRNESDDTPSSLTLVELKELGVDLGIIVGEGLLKRVIASIAEGGKSKLFKKVFLANSCAFIRLLLHLYHTVSPITLTSTSPASGGYNRPVLLDERLVQAQSDTSGFGVGPWVYLGMTELVTQLLCIASSFAWDDIQATILQWRVPCDPSQGRLTEVGSLRQSIWAFLPRFVKRRGSAVCLHPSASDDAASETLPRPSLPQEEDGLLDTLTADALSLSLWLYYGRCDSEIDDVKGSQEKVPEIPETDPRSMTLLESPPSSPPPLPEEAIERLREAVFAQCRLRLQLIYLVLTRIPCLQEGMSIDSLLSPPSFSIRIPHGISTSSSILFSMPHYCPCFPIYPSFSLHFSRFRSTPKTHPF